MLTTAMIIIIVSAATAFGRLLTIERIPVQITESLLSLSNDPIIIILIIIVTLLFVGLFMDTSASIIILTPILLPVVTNMGYDPIHFGIILITGLAIGFITPPVGVNLFVASSISGLPIEAIARACFPFFLVMVLVLIILAFIPQISLFLVGF